MGMTPADQAIIGGMSGAFEVCLMQPTVALKNAVQEGRPLPWNPVHMYRGLGMNILSVAPITATQFGTNFLYNSLHASISGRTEMHRHERLLTSFAAGATSAMAANPTELVVIRQQQTGLSLGAASANLFKKHGFNCIGVALYPTMLREGIYAVGWMEGLPLITEMFSSTKFVAEKLPEGSPHLLGGVAAGVLGATLSHPFDTIKVRMQAFIDKEHPKHDQYNTVFKTVQNTVKEEGWAALLKGVGPRAFRITCAVFILSFCRKEVSPIYLQAKQAVFGQTAERHS